MNPKYAYFLAILVGFAIPFIPEIDPYPFPLGLIYLLTGAFFGFLWPKESWRWGIWIVGPIIVLLGLSVLFAGQLEIFLTKDLPILLLGILASCIGSFLASRFKNRRAKRTAK